jgi:hypothetical protein
MKRVIRFEPRNRAKISLSHSGLNHAASNTPTAMPTTNTMTAIIVRSGVIILSSSLMGHQRSTRSSTAKNEPLGQMLRNPLSGGWLRRCCFSRRERQKKPNQSSDARIVLCHDNGNAEHRRDLNPRSNLAPLLSWWRGGINQTPCCRIEPHGNQEQGHDDHCCCTVGIATFRIRPAPYKGAFRPGWAADQRAEAIKCAKPYPPRMTAAKLPATTARRKAGCDDVFHGQSSNKAHLLLQSENDRLGSMAVPRRPSNLDNGLWYGLLAHPQMSQSPKLGCLARSVRKRA